MNLADHNRLLNFGAMALPVLLVLAVNSIGGDPQDAAAFERNDMLMTGVSEDEKPRRERLHRVRTSGAAADRVRELAELEVTAPPLHVTGFASEPDSEESTIDVAGLPTLTVQAVLAAEGGNTALIGGKAYRVGDAYVDPNWTVIEISAATRSVSLADQAGRVVTGTVPVRPLGSSTAPDET